MTTIGYMTSQKRRRRPYACDICKVEHDIRDMHLIRRQVNRMIICNKCNTPPGWKRYKPENFRRKKKKVDKI
jgi:hypothetical protein